MTVKPIKVRQMEPGEESMTRNLYKNLWLFDRLIFLIVFKDILKSIKKDRGACFLAMDGDKGVGTASVRYKTIKGERHGVIDCVVTDKSLRGQGIGKQILDACLVWFERNGCPHVYATVDRYNSRSWNMFIHQGFTVYDTRQQINDLKSKFLSLWALETYFIGIGTFFLKKTPDRKSSSLNHSLRPAFHFLLAMLVFPGIWYVLALRWHISWTVFPFLFVVVGTALIGHELAHFLAAKAFGLKCVFKIWEPGLLFFFILSLVGGIYPAYGSTYIKQIDWSYRHDERKNGIIYASGPVASFLLALGCLGLLDVINSPLWVHALSLGYMINIFQAMFNLIPIWSSGGFPWDGAKIFSWSKAAWVILVSLVIITLIIRPF